MNENDNYPTTRGMTDADVHRRQYESRRVTARPWQGPVILRHAAIQLPRKWRWNLGWMRVV